MRKDFEEWCIKEHGGQTTVIAPNGEYYEPYHEYWKVWQAALEHRNKHTSLDGCGCPKGKKISDYRTQNTEGK